MQFAKKLREPIMRGNVTTSIRIWRNPRVKVGGLYPLGSGHIKVTRIREIKFEHITPQMARDSGFEGIVDLLKAARHGNGENVYFIEFEYIGSTAKP